MNHSIDRFFYKLERQMEQLSKMQDSEAMRHDLLVRPFLTSPLTLGWEPPELISQSSFSICNEVTESYVWQGAHPKKRRPDMIIVPYGLNRTVAVVEEKANQATLENLRKHLGQLKEYQYIHNTVWGLLTDGEKWILQRNNETFHQFSSLSELKRGIKDIRECIGRDAIISRLNRYGTTDLVVVRPSPIMIVFATPCTTVNSVTKLSDFLYEPSVLGRDLSINLFRSMKVEAYKWADHQQHKVMKNIMAILYNDEFADIVSAVVGFSELSIMTQVTYPQYKIAVDRFLKWIHPLNNYLDYLKLGGTFSSHDVFDICNTIDADDFATVQALRKETEKLSVLMESQRPNKANASDAKNRAAD